MTPPNVVTIPIPKPKVTPPPTPPTTPSASLCVKKNPCYTKKQCSDDGKGGATCGNCPSGFAGNGRSCSDIDDCKGYTACGKGKCSDAGTNANKCACPTGYQVSGSSKQACSLANKCSAGEDDCVKGAKCNHVSASKHTCTCSAGNTGDGTKTGSGCKDINGCANST